MSTLIYIHILPHTDTFNRVLRPCRSARVSFVTFVALVRQHVDITKIEPVGYELYFFLN